MIYKISMTYTKDGVRTPYKLFAKTYLSVCEQINADIFSGFPVLKQTTLKASYQKNDKNHIRTLIPDFELTKFKRNDFPSLGEFNKFKLDNKI